VSRLEGKPLKILWCNIDRSHRVAKHFDSLLKQVKRVANVTVLTHGVGDDHPMVFIEKVINGKIKVEHIITDHIKGHKDYDCIVTDSLFAFMQEDWDAINIPKFMILEDQHGDIAKKTVEFSIKNNIKILHRYQFNKFFTDVPDQIKCVWFPHSVDVDVFKDYGLKKEFSVLQVGALYKMYTIRNEVVKSLKNTQLLKQITRPVETSKTPWPVGVDYAKLINQACLTVTCGADVQYPVMKFFEIGACNSVIYSSYFPELKDLGFIPNINMLEVDRDNIHSQVKTILGHKNRLNELSMNSLRLIQERHTTVIRARELIEILKNNKK
jgi:hypothetical protein